MSTTREIAYVTEFVDNVVRNIKEPQELINVYQSWAINYDEDSLTVGYIPNQSLISKFLSLNSQNQRTSSTLLLELDLLVKC
jgi:hypothetical protein